MQSGRSTTRNRQFTLGHGYGSFEVNEHGIGLAVIVQGTCSGSIIWDWNISPEVAPQAGRVWPVDLDETATQDGKARKAPFGRKGNHVEHD